MSFYVMSTPPSIPVLISPNGSITDTTPAYTWNESTNATRYGIQVYSFSSASYVILTHVTSSACSGGICTYHPSTTLSAGNYKFNVGALNLPYGTSPSPWNYFTVVTAVPGVPGLILPSGTISDQSPAYSWNESSQATSYRIGVYSESTASYVILTEVAASACTGGVCMYDPSTVLDAGNYRFKVLAKNILGASAYSAWMNFIVSP
jgi:hypothetical protein